ncbi:MAG: hypothetical protein V1739_04720 [Candidatus Omnitrophota bacterium]
MKHSIYFQCLIAVLCLMISFTLLPADKTDLSIQVRSERELRESERTEFRCTEAKQVMHIAEYCCLSIPEFNAFDGFLSYTQHNYQPQVQSYILSSRSIHSPPIKHYP